MKREDIAKLAGLKIVHKGFLSDIQDYGEPDLNVAEALDRDITKDRLDRATGKPIYGKPTPTYANIDRVLSLDLRLAGRFAENEFSRRHYISGEELTDTHDTEIAIWLGKTYRLNASPAAVSAVVTKFAAMNSFHPVRNYLDDLFWDGTNRMQNLFSGYMGAKDTPLTQAYGRRFLLSCVARIYRPGCKVDTMVVLKGKQGAFKSTAIRTLAGDAWFSDSPLNIRDTKESALGIQGKWLYEFSELEGLNGRDRQAIKSFLSKSEDRFRTPYGRRADDYQRQTIFVGSTNEDQFLGDPTGSRRFWVVETADSIDIPALKADRDQLWAEAVALYRAGEQWWLTPEEDAGRADHNEAYELEDAWLDPVYNWLEDKAKMPGLQVTAVDILVDALKFSPDRVKPYHCRELGYVLKRLGWIKRRRVRNGVRSWVYHYPGKPSA